MNNQTQFRIKSVADKCILYVMAADPEYGPHLRDRCQPLFTGIGPVEAGTQLSAALARSAAGNTLPHLVVSLGSAGSATLPQTEIFQASSVSYRDMDARPLGFEKGQTPFLDIPIEIEIPWHIDGIPTARLSTGANIVSGATYLEIDADMVDMESFALMRAAQQFNLPFISLRGISDGKTDLNHINDWTRYLHIIDEKLGRAVDKLENAVTNTTLTQP